MSQQTTSWEKTKNTVNLPRTGYRYRFLLGGVVIFIAIGFLIFNGTISNAQYFMTVDDLLARPEMVGNSIRISGAVDGDTIQYDADTLTIRFVMAHIPDRSDNLAETLHLAVNDPAAQRIEVVVRDEPMPDLLQNEAQAIVTGELGTDGIFYADQLLLKCPTRYEEAVPEQVDEAAEAVSG